MKATHLALAAALALTTPHQAVAAHPTEPIEVKMGDYVLGLKFIWVEIAGEDHLFLFDTAGGQTIVTPAVADLIGCQPFGGVVAFRHTGEKLELPRCQPVEMKIGDFTITPSDISQWDIMKAIGNVSPPLGGIAGLALFEEQTITVDFSGKRLWIESAASAAERMATATEIAVRPSRGSGGASLDLMVRVESPAGPLWFELDSGNATSTILSKSSLELLGLDIGEKPQTIELEIAGLGPVALKSRMKDPIIYDGLIGLEFFEERLVTFDLKTMRAWVAPRPLEK